MNKLNENIMDSIDDDQYLFSNVPDGIICKITNFPLLKANKIVNGLTVTT